MRLLWAPGSGRAAVLIDVMARDAQPTAIPRQDLDALLDDDGLIPCDDPHAAAIRTDTSLTDIERSERDRRYDLIAPLIEDESRLVLDPSWRGRLVAERAREVGKERKYFYCYLRLWWQRGQLRNALVPLYARRGGPGRPRLQLPGAPKIGRPNSEARRGGSAGINIDAETRAAIQRSARRLRSHGASWPGAHRDFLRYFCSDQVVLDGVRTSVPHPSALTPTLAQYMYHGRLAITPAQTALRSKGHKKFGRDHRVRPGTDGEAAFGPGSIYLIDATILDVLLRSRQDRRRMIGKPVLYIVTDVYSHMIVGFCVALSGPSWEIAKLALANAMTEKKGYCASLDIDITDDEWPAHHRMKKLTSDRGPELTGMNSDAAALALQYEVVALPSARPDLKGLVESDIGTINDQHIRFAPGAFTRREPGEPVRKLDAVLTITDLERRMALSILRHNNVAKVARPPAGYVSPDGSTPTPLELWNEGCRSRGAPDEVAPSRVRASLLHIGQARESDRGLRFNGLYYLPTERGGMARFVRYDGRSWRQHEVRHDPRDVTRIFRPLDDGTHHVEEFALAPADVRYAGWTSDEVADARAREREGNRATEDERRRRDARYGALIADVDAHAQAAAEGIPLASRRPVGDRAAREVDARALAAEGAWTTAEERNEPVAGSSLASPASAEVSATRSFRSSHLDLLRAMRERRESADDSTT